MAEVQPTPVVQLTPEEQQVLMKAKAIERDKLSKMKKDPVVVWSHTMAAEERRMKAQNPDDQTIDVRKEAEQKERERVINMLEKQGEPKRENNLERTEKRFIPSEDMPQAAKK